MYAISVMWLLPVSRQIIIEIIRRLSMVSQNNVRNAPEQEVLGGFQLYFEEYWVGSFKPFSSMKIRIREDKMEYFWYDRQHDSLIRSGEWLSVYSLPLPVLAYCFIQLDKIDLIWLDLLMSLHVIQCGIVMIRYKYLSSSFYSLQKRKKKRKEK